MKIAIPCENGEVMQHFGHATEFTVYTIEDIKPIEKETVTFDDTNHEKVAGGLKSRGVDLVICGNIGEGAHAAIDNAHMLLISGVTGNADEAVDSFLQGNLELMTGDSSAFDTSGKRISGCFAPGSGIVIADDLGPENLQYFYRWRYTQFVVSQRHRPAAFVYTGIASRSARCRNIHGSESWNF